MKKMTLIKIFFILIGIYGLFGFVGVPYALKNIAPEKVSDATLGGTFSVGSASFNPFSFYLQLHDVAFKTPKKSDFVHVNYCAININPLEYLWKSEWVIDEIFIEKPLITIHKDAAGEMNFGWLTSLGGDENQSTEVSNPLALLMNAFTLKEGKIDYSDESEGKNYRQSIHSIGFHLENINLRDVSNSHGMMRVYASINERGFVDLRGKIAGLKPFALKGSVTFNSGKLYTPWRYFKEKLPLEVADGTAGFGFNYVLSTADINATKLSQVHVELNRLRLLRKVQQTKLLDAGSVKITEGTVWPMRKVFVANGVKLNALSMDISRSRDGVIDWIDYIDQIKKAFPEDENETKIPWQVAVRDIALENMEVRWSDMAPREPYSATLSGINLYSHNLSSDPKKRLNGTLSSGSFQLQRLGDLKAITGFGRMEMKGIMLHLDAKRAGIESLAVEGGDISLKRLKNGTIDLKRLLYTQNQKGERAQDTPWSYGVREIAFHNTRVHFTDEVPLRRVQADVDELGLRVKGFSSDPRAMIEIEGSGKINKKATIKIHSQLVRETLHSKGEFELNHFSLPLIDPYIEASSYAQLRRGDLSINGSYSYAPAKSAVQGKLALSDWVVEDRRDHSVLLGWNRIGMTPFVYAYPDNRLKINQLGVDGLYTNVLIDRNKVLNLSTLNKAKKGKAKRGKPDGHPFGIDVVKLAVANSSATFSDLSLPLPFKTYIHDLNGQVVGISTTKDVTTFVRLKGGVDQYGLAKIDGSLNTKAPKSFTDIQVVFENLELKHYTPYSLQFLGYKIANGKLFLTLGYKINGGKLDGKNQVVIKHIELGEEKAGGSPWPMRLVVALLEDGDGIIDVDLPIHGDVNRPDFKYGKVVWQVIGNLLTKAVTSPFKLLGSLLGLEADDESLSSISFEAGEDTLTPPQVEQLDKLAAVLVKRPKLSLQVHGSWDGQVDDRALRLQKLIHVVIGEDSEAISPSADAMSLEMLEKTAKKLLKRSDVKELRNAMEEHYTQEADFVRHYTDALIEKLILLQVVTPAELNGLATRRSQGVVAYLHKNPALANRVTAGENEKADSKAKSGVPSRLDVSVK